MDLDKPHVLHLLTPSRKRRCPGDIFAMKTDDGYLFGRVVFTNANWGHSAETAGANLIYIYRGAHQQLSPIPFQQLTPENLLIPPVMTNNLGWSRGYFETISNVPLSQSDTLAVHCFEDHGAYFNERGESLIAASTPVGVHGLASYLIVDSMIETALGSEQ